MGLHLPETALAAQALPHQMAMGLLVRQLQQRAGPLQRLCLHSVIAAVRSNWCIFCWSSLLHGIGGLLW